jgi:hypothetical protein|tara:strand:+ start:994 stop:1545 length:552 start_codon:yes stop_codon:yes gene_type:complete
MAAKGKVIEKPNTISNLIVFGNFVEGVLISFKQNVYDKEEKKNFLEVEYKPTGFMRWIEQIDYATAKDFDRVTFSFKSRFPMDFVGHVEPRTEGLWIFMLCDYLGNKCDVFEKIDSNLFEQNKKLQNKVNTLQSIIIGMDADFDEMIKHPQEFKKKLYKEAEFLKKALAPAVINTTGEGVPPE